MYCLATVSSGTHPHQLTVPEVAESFDESELEQMYYETAVDNEAEGKAYMERVRRQRMDEQSRETARAVD